MSKVIKSSVEPGVTAGRTIAIKPLSTTIDLLPSEADELTKQQQAEQQLEQMEQRAQQMLDEAEIQSQQLAELFEKKEKELSLQAKQLFDEHQTKGFEEGYKQGEAAAWAEYSDKLLEAQDVVQAAAVQREEMFDQAEPEMIEMACMLAEKILGQTIKQDEAKIQFLRKLLYEAREHEDIKLLVPPDWYTYVSEQKHELQSMLLSSSQMLIMPDHQLEAHSCVLESKQGRLETSLDKQLVSLKEQLLTKQKELSYDSSGSV
ncbi:flagellar assembly protein FliH [Alkalicoccobacillus porphyridii]|uniref:flagellar assembly protein FliH n=1 Tax=Alkalicoccobacillus porphyridii TaxID=2597270 RepID=UPI00163D9983|nr:flagellar assembly protein FliH [Alkalicoccobacillus porphyridii]